MTGESITRYDYQIHPLTALFPELPAKEFEELKEDIRKNGLLEPLIISSKNRHVLLDGRNRLRACEELGITPYTCFFELVRHNNMTEEEFILSKNLFRRHLSPDQRAMLVAQCADEIEKAARERQSSGLRKGDHSSVGSNSTQRERTRESVSKTANVSQHKARQALAIRKDGQLTGEVASGKKSLKQASKEVARKQKPAATNAGKKPKENKTDPLVQVVYVTEEKVKQPEQLNVCVHTEPAPEPETANVLAHMEPVEPTARLSNNQRTIAFARSPEWTALATKVREMVCGINVSDDFVAQQLIECEYVTLKTFLKVIVHFIRQ